MNSEPEIRAEIDRICYELSADFCGPRAAELLAANQALSWALDPLIAAAPVLSIMGRLKPPIPSAPAGFVTGTQAVSAGCSKYNRQSES